MPTELRPSCPKCGSHATAGFVDVSAPPLREELDSGRAVLGGCSVSAESKDRRCLDCGHEWGTIVVDHMDAHDRKLAAERAEHDALAAKRGVWDAQVRPDRWTTCPYCGWNFATYAEMSWDGQKHLSCGTRLRLHLLPPTEEDHRPLKSHNFVNGVCTQCACSKIATEFFGWGCD